MTKWLVGTVALTGCALALGCGAEKGSTQGLVRQLVAIRPREGVRPEYLQEAQEAIRALPSRFPAIERLEWGKTGVNDPDAPTHYCFLLTFKDRQTLDDPAYWEERRKAISPYMLRSGWQYVAQDATPRSRTATRGHLRRAVRFTLKQKDITTEETRKVEDAIVALPSKVPTIERLEWGRVTHDPKNPSGHCLLFTFKDAAARDACFAHPAYEEFQRTLKEHCDPREPFMELEYVARDP